MHQELKTVHARGDAAVRFKGIWERAIAVLP